MGLEEIMLEEESASSALARGACAKGRASGAPNANGTRAGSSGKALLVLRLRPFLEASWMVLVASVVLAFTRERMRSRTVWPNTSKYINNVAAVAAKVGCYLKIWTGNMITFKLIYKFIRFHKFLKHPFQSSKIRHFV